MKYNTLTIIISFLICFLTLLITIFTLNIKSYKPAQIYADKKEKYLIFSNQEDFDYFKNKKSFKALINKKEVILYKKSKQNKKDLNIANSIIVTSNDIVLENGWLKLFLYEKSETFIKHYLRI